MAELISFRTLLCFRFRQLFYSGKRHTKTKQKFPDVRQEVSPLFTAAQPATFTFSYSARKLCTSSRILDAKQSYRRKFYDYVRTDPGFNKTVFITSVASPDDLSSLKEQLRKLFVVRSAVFQGQVQKEVDVVLKGRLDNQTAIALSTCSLDDALCVMDLWASVSDFDKRVPKCFKVFLEKLAVLDQPFTIRQTLQILFYCAIYRKLTPVVKEKLRQVIFDNVSTLDSLQLELVCFAFYVLKIECRDDLEFISIVADKTLEERLDLTSAVSALKFLRQNNYVDLQFFRRLDAKLHEINLEAEANSVECCHLLQSFVSAKFYSDQLFEKVQDKVLKDIQTQTDFYAEYSTEELVQMHPSQRLRIKDIANFLYSFAVINHKIEHVDVIILDLKNRLEGGEYAGMPYFLVQSVYALSIQGVYDLQLLAAVFSEETVWKLVQDGWKDAQRWLYCLYKNCQIECSEGLMVAEVSETRLQNGLPKDFFNVGYEMSCRDENLIECVRKDLAKEYGSDAVNFRRLIPHVEVCGFDVRVSSAANLLAQLSKVKNFSNTHNVSEKICFDVLDVGWTSAVNVERLLGNLVLKNRLLELTGWKTRIRKDVLKLRRNLK